MGEIIAYKKGGVGIMYHVCTLFSIGLFFASFALWPVGIICTLAAVVLCAISASFSVNYLMLPSIIMRLDDEGNLILPNNIALKFEEIVDISYKRATARGFSYRWGSVTVKTASESHTYQFVADCEEVAKRLTDDMYRARYTKENSQ